MSDQDLPREDVGGEDQLLRMTKALVGEVFRTAWLMENVISCLKDDLPDEAFPGTRKTEALFDAIVGSVRPATFAAGEEGCRTATALVAAVRDRILGDLEASVAGLVGGGEAGADPETEEAS